MICDPDSWVGLKLNKMFREHYHDHRGITDRVDYLWTHRTEVGSSTHEARSVFFSIEKAKEGGWTFLGRHFNSIQGAKKEAKKYCNDKAAEIYGKT